uniref:Uncharacterized protein LOC102809997 n=1 Tax=Saccoglossus kowalevskii TaxID=10224 RepID=A0ABM0LYK7_SACKO
MAEMRPARLIIYHICDYMAEMRPARLILYHICDYMYMAEMRLARLIIYHICDYMAEMRPARLIIYHICDYMAEMRPARLIIYHICDYMAEMRPATLIIYYICDYMAEMRPILQCIATVCHYQYRNHSNTVLCEAIHNISDTLEESNTKLTNLLELLTSLLKPYSLALDVNSSPLLNVLEFVRTCCLPYLGFHENQVSPLTALQLLRVTMVISKSTDHLWLKTLPIFPIMLCLCNIIGECDMMWDNGCYGDQMIEIKDLSVDLLYHFIKTLHESPTKGMEKHLFIYHYMKRIVRWLQSRLQSVRWTVLLYLDQFLCQQITHHKKSVPRELFSICDLPLDDWQPLDHQEQDEQKTSEKVVTVMKIDSSSNKSYEVTHKINFLYTPTFIFLGNENCYGFLTFLQCCQVSSELGERLT